MFVCEGRYISQQHVLFVPLVGLFSDCVPVSTSQTSDETAQLLFLVAEWIHFTLFGRILHTIKLKVRTFGGFSN